MNVDCVHHITTKRLLLMSSLKKIILSLYTIEIFKVTNGMSRVIMNETFQLSEESTLYIELLHPTDS